MKVLWGRSPLTSGEIVEALREDDPSWHPKTAQTLIGRLVKKGAIAYEARSRVYFYRPVLSEEACVAVESQSFLSRVFGGSLKPMLAHFVDHRKLSKAEIEELKRILEKGK